MSNDYEVGYGKPPEKTQWQKGRSGNPKGRPKGVKNLKTELLEEFLETIPVKEGGNRKMVSKQRAMIKSLMAKAVQGDARAASTLLNMFLKLVPEEPDDKEVIDLTKTDEAILREFEAAILKDVKSKGKKNA